MGNRYMEETWNHPMAKRNVQSLLLECRSVAANAARWSDCPDIADIEPVLFAIAYCESGSVWYISEQDLRLLPGEAGEIGPWQITRLHALDTGTPLRDLETQAHGTIKYISEFMPGDLRETLNGANRHVAVYWCGALHHYGRTCLHDMARRHETVNNDNPEWCQYRDRLIEGLHHWERLQGLTPTAVTI